MKGQRAIKRENNPNTPDIKNWLKEFDLVWDELEMLANGDYGVQMNYKATLLLHDFVNRHRPFWWRKFGVPIKERKKDVR